MTPTNFTSTGSPRAMPNDAPSARIFASDPMAAPLVRYGVWELLDVIRLAGAILFEAALQMPFAIADEGERFARRD